jgi:hypothetical protein
MTAGHDPKTRHRWLLLWGLPNRGWDAVLSLGTALLLILSRAALMASGPWEWDETIFARGMLHFELAAHFPHPPGFPGLLALGHLLLPLADTPYRALQWLSAIASICCLWPLAALGRRVAPPAVATAAALLVLFLPGPWLYSVRGFSTWTATALALGSVALWAGGLRRRRATWFTLLATVSFLVRPILLPTLALLWLAGISTVKPIRRALPGAIAGAALVAISVAVMVRLEGGWSAFIGPFITHAEFHAARLHLNEPGVLSLGLVKGAGGLAPAAALLVASVIGIAAWGRRVGARVAATWIVILALTVGQLIFLQNRSYARYAVVVHVAAAPLLAGAAVLAPAPVAVAALLGLAGAAASTSLPLLREQHRDRFGAWEATVDAARLAGERGWAAVVEPEVHVFSSYWWHLLEWRGGPAPPMVLSPRAPEPWLGVRRPWVVATVHPHLYMPSLTGRVRSYGQVSNRLQPLTQSRFLAAELIENPPLPIGQWWTRERLPDGTVFMWAGPDAELWLPPVPRDTAVGIGLRPAPGEAPLSVEVTGGGPPWIIDGNASPTWLWTRTTGSSEGPVVVRLRRDRGYPPGGGDDRPLSAQLLGVAVRPRGAPVAGPVATEADRQLLRLEVDGCYGAEDFDDAGSGVWLQPEARLRFTVDEPGRIVLLIAAPRQTPARPRFVVEGGSRVGPLELAPGGNRISIDVGARQVADGIVELELFSEAFIPSEAGVGADSRRLGVVLLGLEFEPAEPSRGWWSP